MGIIRLARGVSGSIELKGCEKRLTEIASDSTGAGYFMVCTTLYVLTSYTLTIWSNPPVNSLLARPSNARTVTVFSWFDIPRTHRPPANRSDTRRIGPD